ncbi:MAG TPA: hypothetical protein VFJ91_05395 [Gaiellaceae bacterium]|nr:hypothetical protein [Gaiellaceae bacterium]
METVETVLGPVPLAELGPTLAHEHVFVLEPEALRNYGHALGEPWWDEEARVAAAVATLSALRAAGVRTIVDATAIGLGRDVGRVRRVAEAVGLNVIVASGVYSFLELPRFLAYRSDEQLVELFVRELREGIDDTGIRAAFLKCAVEAHGLAGDVPRILRLIAAAAVETGAPVMVHTNARQRTGLLALEALTEAGVDPRRIVVAHAGDSNDLDYLRALADTGAWLGLDRFGWERFNPDEQRIETLLALLEAGYGDRLHLGHDAACFYDFMAANPRFAPGEGQDYLLIPERILPRLRDAGVTQEQIDELLVETPRRFFAG